MKFLLELMLAEMMFLFPADKRSRFPLRLLLILTLCLIGQLLLPTEVSPSQTLLAQ